MNTDSHNARLRAAAEADDRATMLELLECDADPNSVSETGWTALHHAAVNGHAEAVKLFLRAGADPEIPVEEPGIRGVWAMSLAVINGHVETVAALVAGGADVNQRSPGSSTALGIARDALAGHVRSENDRNRIRRIIEMLEQEGATE